MGADFFFCTFVLRMTTRRTLLVQALLVVGLLSAGLQAQSVGIGTATPHPSARLHIEDNARGLLIPNVALTATNVAAPVTSPATSLLVYNTATAGAGATAVTPGFYYWNGIQWVRLMDGGSGGGGGGNAWLITGNAGTNPAVNFLGTTDNNSLRIRVNNQQTFQFNTNSSIQRDDGGNARGQDAVDLQRVRSAATQVASGSFSVIGGGQNNTASGIFATVGGGGNNTASNNYATVGGGENNTASGQNATVGGGYRNTASNTYATVGGGYINTASGFAAIVGGGWNNTASGNYAVVLGGLRNTANAEYNLVYGADVVPSVTEAFRVYFFADGGIGNNPPSGFLVINRLDGDFPIHVGTNNTNGNGARLTGGGVWTNGSSRSFKERFVQYRPAEVLEKILQLPVEGYFYKGTQEYHITPMAEDFYRLFGTGVHEIIETDSTGQLVRRPNPDVDKYLAASDVAGVALLGIQALHEENAQLRQQVSDMRMEDAQLRQRVSDLERENAQLRQQISDIRTENAALRARLERLEALVHKIASTQTSP
jgi:hypothetical protein